MTVGPDPILLSGGSGSFVTTVEGRKLLDLAMGFGSAFLGHAHPTVIASVQRQVGGLWNASRMAIPGQDRVDSLLSALLPRGLRPAGLYSTGMEAAEFAMRVAATHTGRDGFAGFARGMHGKSAMTAALCWPNAPIRPKTQHILPFVAQAGEAEILDGLDRLLRTRSIAALFVEPIQGSNGAHQASDEFYRQALARCREYGTLCVFDEILTGLHRTGTPFFVDRLGETPDMLLFAKCMGNGFPVSSLALAAQVKVRPEALPGSTFSGNPLAVAAVEGTLTAMAQLDMRSPVMAIEESVRAALGPLQEMGNTLRGTGAIWCLELGEATDAQAVFAAIRAAGLMVTASGRSIRLLPAATIDPAVLREACESIAGICREAWKGAAVTQS